MDDVKYTKKVTAFNDDDIPYEVRMKHIIEAYRKDLKRLEALEKYAKGLEEENLLLQKKMEKTDNVVFKDTHTKPSKEIFDDLDDL